MTVWGNGYYYFETPDYEDCLKKIWVASKISAIICSSYWAFDMLVERVQSPRAPMPPSYLLGRFARYNGAPLATVVCGATTTSIISRMRGNADDGWNYFLGYGIPAGIIWTVFHGTVKNHPIPNNVPHSMKGAFAGFAVACTAAMIKKGHISDYAYVPEATMFGNLRVAGPFGGDHWGDMRHPSHTWDDTGRRPQF